METLEQFRQEIDNLDEQIISLLGDRFNVCRKVAKLKKEQGIPRKQLGRREQVKQHCRDLAIKHDINPDLIIDVYNLIIQGSCQLEDQIIGNQESSN